MIKRLENGVITVASSTNTNARASVINRRIQWTKKMACGYRKRERIRVAVFFHLGGLDLSPDTPSFRTTR